jgi:NAD(P)-dependent dehydrogenase (short-subunit alcohol dehydrogenase family)
MKKVWFVTGSSRGIGAHIAIAALEAGHSVVATARQKKKVPQAILKTSVCFASHSMSRMSNRLTRLHRRRSNTLVKLTCSSTMPDTDCLALLRKPAVAKQRQYSIRTFLGSLT